MNNRVQMIEDNLNVTLPKNYKNFINKIGIISDERGEVYGYLEKIDIEKIPSVIAATKLYKQDYPNLLSEEIVISFNDFNNTPIILNTKDGKIYDLYHHKKKLIATNFLEWLEINNYTTRSQTL